MQSKHYPRSLPRLVLRCVLCCRPPGAKSHFSLENTSLENWHPESPVFTLKTLFCFQDFPEPKRGDNSLRIEKKMTLPSRTRFTLPLPFQWGWRRPLPTVPCTQKRTAMKFPPGTKAVFFPSPRSLLCFFDIKNMSREDSHKAMWMEL